MSIMLNTLHSQIINEGIPKNVKKVFVLTYFINKHHIKPYIEFGFNENDKIQFIELETFMKEYIKKNFKNYKGFIKEDDSIFLIMNSKEKNNNITWLLPDEIINQQHFFGIKVDKSVYDFFIKNDKLIYLEYDEKILEQPIALYKTTKDYGLYSLGIPKRLNYDSLSYYENFELFENNRLQKMRYIVYLGNTELKVGNNPNSLFLNNKYYIKSFSQQKPTIYR